MPEEVSPEATSVGKALAAVARVTRDLYPHNAAGASWKHADPTCLQPCGSRTGSGIIASFAPNADAPLSCFGFIIDPENAAASPPAIADADSTDATPRNPAAGPASATHAAGKTATLARGMRFFFLTEPPLIVSLSLLPLPLLAIVHVACAKAHATHCAMRPCTSGCGRTIRGPCRGPGKAHASDTHTTTRSKFCV
jgi:hypothetical protein